MAEPEVDLEEYVEELETAIDDAYDALVAGDIEEAKKILEEYVGEEEEPKEA